jgi:FAD/FMN-containing dehydrogenase
VSVNVCWCGPIERGEAVLAPLRRFGSPLLDAIAVRPYTQLQGMFDPVVPHGWHYYWKSWEVPPFTDAAIDALVEQAGRITSPRSYIIVFQLGGAIARPPADTAYRQRDAAHNVNINAVWLAGDPDADRHMQWTRECFDALEPAAAGRAYVNFMADEGQDRVRAAYGAETYDRLVALKRRYDPGNVLRRNQNVDPAYRSAAGQAIR